MRHRKTAGGVQDNGRDVSRDEWNDRHVPDTRAVGFFTDFFAVLGEGYFSSYVSGGTAVLANTALGAVSLATGTGATGRGALIWPSGNPAANLVHILGSGVFEWEARVRIPVLSDGTNTFLARFGLLADPAIGTNANAVSFEYNPATRGNGNWWAVTRNATTESATDTGVAASTNFQVLRFEANAAGTSIVFGIDGTTVHTETANVPSGMSKRMGHGATILKSAGTTAREVQIDYWQQWWTPTGGRPAT